MLLTSTRISSTRCADDIELSLMSLSLTEISKASDKKPNSFLTSDQKAVCCNSDVEYKS